MGGFLFENSLSIDEKTSYNFWLMSIISPGRDSECLGEFQLWPSFKLRFSRLQQKNSFSVFCAKSLDYRCV